MRSFIFLLSAFLLWPHAHARRAQTGPQITDNREPFAIELPEFNTGLLPAAAHLEIPVPVKPLTRLRLWVVQPFAARIGYRGINATFNQQSLSTVTKKGSGAAGNFLDIDLRANPNLVWRADKNVLEITAQEERGNLAYRCTFVLLPGKAAATTTRRPRPSLAEGCATEISTETQLAPADPHVLQSDRVAPQLTLTAPQAAFNATSVVQTVLVTGSASDDSGLVRSVTVNGQVIANTPIPKDKRFKLPPLKKSDKNKAAAPPPPLTFNASFTVAPDTRALLIEAADHSGNRIRITVPILQPDCIAPVVAQRQAALAATTTAGFSGRRYAVVVGVSKYKFHEGGLRDLSYAHQDAESIRDWLRAESGFKRDDIVCLTDGTATRAAVRDALARFLTTAGANDLIYLFMAGHGAPDPFDRSKLYFLLHDSKLTDVPNTALAMSAVGEFVNTQSKQARLIAFFDTCHSAGVNRQALSTAPAPVKQGAADKRGVGARKDKQGQPPVNQSPTVTLSVGAPAAQPGFNFYEGALFQKKGWTVVSSSGMNEESQEAAHWQDAQGRSHGVFTWALLNGLQGAADQNADCRITATELFAYLRAVVSQQTGGAQNPQLLPGGSGDLVLVQTAEKATCRK